MGKRRRMLCSLRWVAPVGMLLVGAVGCDAQECLACDSPQQAGSIQPEELTEISGVTPSLLDAGVIYGHNDSGDRSRLFAMGLDGALVSIVEVDDVPNDDWEDIAAGPCASGTCLYIADIGDNDLSRERYAVHIVPEPQDLSAQTVSVEGSSIEFEYDDGAHDAETLLVHPTTGAITIVTKEDSGAAGIYELPTQLLPGEVHTASRVGSLDPPKGSSRFTGGAVHPDGRGVLVRTKSRLFHFEMGEGDRVADVLAGDPCRLPLADEDQGEAVAWLRDGETVLTVGEGHGAPINTTTCRNP